MTATSFAQAPLDFTMYDQDSVSWNLYDELGKGNTVLLDFFFAACVPCQTLTPQIQQLYLDYGAGTQNLIVLGISDRDNNAALAAFDTTYGGTYPTCGIEGNGDSITDEYRNWFPFSAWPRYAVICKDTSIFWQVTPDSGMVTMRKMIDSCDVVTDITTTDHQHAYFDVYPNPSQGALNITASDHIEGELDISLYNLQGALVKKIMVNSAQLINWELNDITAGYYLIEIAQNGALYHREKLLLIH